jgi:hypothetical protein
VSPANAKRLAWGLVVLAHVLTVGSIIISMIGGNRVEFDDAFIWTITFAFAVAGQVIATRHPTNAIGWLCLAVSTSAALGRLSGAYAAYWLATGAGSDGLGQAAAWYGTISWIPFILVPATFLLLVFPDGHLLTARWRPLAWCAVFGIAGALVATGLNPGPLEDYPEIANPYGVESPLLTVLNVLSSLACFVGLLGSAISMFLRFRRASGEQRQQMKWIALAGALVAVTIVLAILSFDLIGAAATNVAIMLSVLTLPVATAIAILRYRLYDIDVVINRTLVYGSLTAILGATYVGSVLVLQLALSGLTQGSGLAVAASTLAVAALFRPARARIQQAVDRRFFRSRFDVARTIESFGARLRDEVDLSALSADLQAVVVETMRPDHVSLWLRQAQGGHR